MSKYSVGVTSLNKSGRMMKIVSMRNTKDMDIVFEDDEYVISGVQSKQFKNGTLRDPLTPTSSGVGYLGYGEYNSINSKEAHDKWSGMLKRCYNKRSQDLAYLDISSVCEEWHNFQNFAKWHEENYVEFGEGCMCIDKDFLIKDNKVYSPETCLFLDNKINIMIKSSGDKNKKLPKGVHNTHNGRYVAMCRRDGDDYSKVHDTIEEAFKDYKRVKESYIKQVADEYRSKYPNFPQKVYDAMYNYKVEIDD